MCASFEKLRIFWTLRKSNGASTFLVEAELEYLFAQTRAMFDVLQKIEAIEHTFGADVDYAQLVKIYAAIDAGPGRYSPPRVSETVSTVIQDSPDPEHISTSYVERQNLTMRMAMRRFTRLTNAFSKKLANLKAALALHFAHYNFMRVHRMLRVTPAIEAKLTDHIWTWDELLTR